MTASTARYRPQIPPTTVTPSSVSGHVAAPRFVLGPPREATSRNATITFDVALKQRSDEGAMPKVSAGLLMFRTSPAGLEFFLVHPGGPFFTRRDDGWWTIPKGLMAPDETPLQTARREFAEETGLTPPDTGVFPLGDIQQQGGKIVHAWAFEGDCDPSRITSNTFSLEWPPKSGRRRSFPEVDRADFFPLEVAKKKILPSQAVLLDRLVALLDSNSHSAAP